MAADRGKDRTAFAEAHRRPSCLSAAIERAVDRDLDLSSSSDLLDGIRRTGNDNRRKCWSTARSGRM
jgi:hypothetical protein